MAASHKGLLISMTLGMGENCRCAAMEMRIGQSYCKYAGVPHGTYPVVSHMINSPFTSSVLTVSLQNVCSFCQWSVTTVQPQVGLMLTTLASTLAYPVFFKTIETF